MTSRRRSVPTNLAMVLDHYGITAEDIGITVQAWEAYMEGGVLSVEDVLKLNTWLSSKTLSVQP